MRAIPPPAARHRAWIPALTTGQLGRFRLFLGVAFALTLLRLQITPRALADQRHYAALDLDLVHSLAASADALVVVKVVAITAALLFAIGAAPRLSLAFYAAGFLTLTLVVLEDRGTHDLGLPLITLLGWLTVPWDDTPSLWSPWRPGGPASRRYGFAIWWPGLTLGLALLAAGIAKLLAAGPIWATGGAVRYHFVMDAGSAPLEWGLWVASHPPAAIALSCAALALELGFILVVFTDDARWRLLAGVAGVALFAGLFLFQGIQWHGWHTLLLAFLPWQGVEPAGWARRLPSISPFQIAAVVVVLVVQGYASVWRIEAEPFLSDYPMYSSTFASPAAFDREMADRYTTLVSVSGDGAEHREAVMQMPDSERRNLLDLQQRLRDIGTARPLQGERWLVTLCEAYRTATGSMPERVAVRVERGGFDWNAGTFRSPEPLTLDPMPLAHYCRQAGGE